MSHYVVGVITEDIKNIDNILAPYNENIEVAPWIDMTKEELVQEYKDAVEAIKNKTNDYLVERNKEEDLLGMTQEEFSKWYHGFNFDIDGNLLTTYNPKSKWDWYVVGGRWDNYLKLKNGEKANYAKIKDIDFSLNKDEYEEAERYWEIVVEGSPLKDGEEEPFNLYKTEYYLERYKTKENYATSIASFSTFAIIHNGVWYEKGQMGWFGMSSATNDSEKEYKDKFKKIIESADPEDYFVIVDCHI